MARDILGGNSDVLSDLGGSGYSGRAPGIGQSPRETYLSAFQSGHGFTSQGTGSLTDDSTTVNGTQSLRLNTDGAQGVTIARATSLPTVDFSGKLVAAQFQVNGSASLGSLKLRLASGTITTDYAEVTLATQPDSYLMSGRWETQVLGRSEFTVVGSVNWAAINKAELRLVDTGSTMNVRMGYLAAREALPSKGIVSFGFDDGWLSQYTTALPILSKYRMPASLFVIADLVGTGGYVTQTNLEDLRDYHGWDIAPHAATAANHNLTNGFNSMADETSVATEMQSIIDWCAARGFNTNHWAAPKGQIGGVVRRPAKQKFRFTRGTLAGPETMPPRNFAAGRGWAVNASTDTVAAIKAAVDKAATDKTWLILTFHKIQSSVSDPVTEWLTSDFTSIVDYVATKDVRVRTTYDVLSGAVT